MIDFSKPIRGRFLHFLVQVLWNSADHVLFTYEENKGNPPILYQMCNFVEQYENVPEEPISYYLAVDKAALDKHIKSMTDDRWFSPVSAQLIRMNDATAKLFNECSAVSSLYVKVYPYENPSSDN